jgi:hypothetical protein
MDTIIIGLPRSMTAWMSNWLTDGGRICLHEGMLRYNSFLDMISDESIHGNSDSSLALMPDEVIRYGESYKIGIIERDKDSCIESYRDHVPEFFGIRGNEILESIDKCIEGINRIKYSVECSVIKYSDIRNKDIFRKFHNSVSDIEFNEMRYDVLTDLNIQQDTMGIG